MANLAEIIKRELHCSSDIRKGLSQRNQWYLVLKQNQDGSIEEIGSEFEWRKKEFLMDMIRLWELKVRGIIIIKVDEEVWLKYELTEKGVEEFVGAVQYPEVPNKIYQRKGDIR